MSETYNLIFFPTLKQGADESDVKARLASTLKLDPEKVDGWFTSGKPTVLLKDVAPDVADRYMQAILKCGGTCNMQPSGGQSAGGLSLVPKPAKVNLFYCPGCEYEEELAPGITYEQCPKCDLVIDKWEEHQEEERKKEEIRRRLLREARYKDDSKNEQQRKKEELEYLRKLEREIMKELGIKPPGRLWTIFSGHPVSISASIGILLIAVSSAVSYYVSDYFDNKRQSEIAAAPASDEIQQMAPMVASAVSLQQSGNETLMKELAETSKLMQGKQAANAKLLKATEQMMKGADASEFLKSGVNQNLKTTTPGGLGEPAPMVVNRDTIGGVSGLPGVRNLDAAQLEGLTPNSAVHGYDDIAAVISKKIPLPDPSNPNGPDILVDQIEKLDGSMVVDLLKRVSIDLEWDQYLFSQVKDLVRDGLMEQASELTAQIKNPMIKVNAYTASIERLVNRDPDADLRQLLSRVSTQLTHVPSYDSRAKSLISLASLMSYAGVVDEPNNTLGKVEAMLDEVSDPVAKAEIAGQLAVAYIDDREQAREFFQLAQREATKAQDVSARVAAFTMIAQRYYDARNITLAGEILREAQILTATNLKVSDRAPVFGRIAAAQIYMGDVTGALQSVNNAATGDARDAILSTLAAWMISEGRIYQAQSLMSVMKDQPEVYRLAIRLISHTVNSGDKRKAAALIGEYSPRASRIPDQSERALILGQFARLYLRIGDESEAEDMFNAALTVSAQLEGRKAAVSRGLIAIDQMRGLWVQQGKETMSNVREPIVREPLESELISSERIIKNLLP